MYSHFRAWPGCTVPGVRSSPGGCCGLLVDSSRLVVLGVALAALTRGHLGWARTLQREHASEHDTLQAVTAAAVQAVPGAENATITLVVGRTKVQTRAATGARARRTDELQTELDDGPCLTTIWEQETVHIPDMATESRWPRFAAAAAEAGVGVGAVLCCASTVRPRRHPRGLEPLRPDSGGVHRGLGKHRLDLRHPRRGRARRRPTRTPTDDRVGESEHHRPKPKAS